MCRSVSDSALLGSPLSHSTGQQAARSPRQGLGCEILTQTPTGDFLEILLSMSTAAFSSPEKRKEKNSKILQRQQRKGETTQVLTVQYAQALLLLIWITGIPYHRKEMVQIRKNCAPAQAEESSSRAGSNVGSSAHLHPHSSCRSHGFSRECCKDLWVVMQTKCMEGFEVYLSFLQLCCQSYHLILSLTPPFCTRRWV